MMKNALDKDPEFHEVTDLSVEEQELHSMVLACKRKSEALGRTDQVILAKAYLNAVRLVIDAPDDHGEKRKVSGLH